MRGVKRAGSASKRGPCDKVPKIYNLLFLRNLKSVPFFGRGVVPRLTRYRGKVIVSPSIPLGKRTKQFPDNGSVAVAHFRRWIGATPPEVFFARRRHGRIAPSDNELLPFTTCSPCEG